MGLCLLVAPSTLLLLCNHLGGHSASYLAMSGRWGRGENFIRSFVHSCNTRQRYKVCITSKKYEPLASFPGLPGFYFPFVFTIIHGSGRSVKMGKAWEHSSREWCQVDVGGAGVQPPKQRTASSIQVLYCSFGLQTLAWPVRNSLSTSHTFPVFC